MNNNEKTILALREAADYLAAHPDIPPFGIVWLNANVYKKEELKAAARAMGSFDKVVSEHSYSLIHNIGPLKIEVTIPRHYICEKIVTWKCPDDPLLDLDSEPAK